MEKPAKEPVLSLEKRFMCSFLRTLLWIGVILFVLFIVRMYFRIEELYWLQKAADAKTDMYQAIDDARHS